MLKSANETGSSEEQKSSIRTTTEMADHIQQKLKEQLFFKKNKRTAVCSRIFVVKGLNLPAPSKGFKYYNLRIDLQHNKQSYYIY